MMTRKEFIRQGVALGIGIPLLALLLESCDDSYDLHPDFRVNFSGKVIIVGAGAAGITAGYLLNRYGIDFQIIEASSVFGGRVKRSSDFADFPIDLGGEWLHDHPSILARLISDSSIDATVDLITYSPDTIYNWDGDKLKKQNWASNFYSEYKFKNTTWYGFFEKYMIPKIGNKIIYNSPVNEINYSGDKVIVRNTNNETFEADKVLVTASINVLQSGMINFTPALPSDKTNVINGIFMGDGLKVFIEFKENFYPDILIFGDILSAISDDSKIFYNAAYGKDSDKNILGLFTINEKAAEYTNLATEQEIIDKIIAELDEIFEGKASQHYVKHIIQNWSKEPYVRGSYSYEYDQSEDEAKRIILEPVDNKIYFAGEALDYDSSSTVHGAAESAYAVVETILQG